MSHDAHHVARRPRRIEGCRAAPEGDLGTSAVEPGHDVGAGTATISGAGDVDWLPSRAVAPKSWIGERFLDLSMPIPDNFVRLRVRSHDVGVMSPETADVLLSLVAADRIERHREAPGYLSILPPSGGIRWLRGLFHELAIGLAERGLAPAPQELIALRTAASADSLTPVPRSLALALGLLMIGIHVNLLVADEQGHSRSIWVARRALDHPSYPGILDNAVAGVIEVGQTWYDALIAEAWEEAGITSPDCRAAILHAGYRYRLVAGNQVARGVAYIVDLPISSLIVPRNVDGSVDSFDCVRLPAVLDRFRARDAIKPTSCLAFFDLFHRTGICLEPEEEHQLREGLGSLFVG